MTRKFLALIPARSGSKSIPHKNIRLFRGKPLLAHSIRHALDSVFVNRVIVSTDSLEYAKIAREYGAEVPFLRPVELAQDWSTDLEVFEHALLWLKEHEGYEPDICVHLRPTYPVRNAKDIDSVITILLQNPDVDSVRSVAPGAETPFKMWFRNEKGLLDRVLKSDIHEAHNLPRQALPPVFVQNACIDAVRSRVILEHRSMTGKTIYGYLMDANYDIDTDQEFQRALEASSDPGIKREDTLYLDQLGGGVIKTFCFDIDGVIATIVPSNSYEESSPIGETIMAINHLYNAGHRIILCTARGSATGIDWRQRTELQMKAWGVRYHELRFGKPAADYYIEDKTLSLKQLKTLVEEMDRRKDT
jgi:CMP-N-acetylneuraminic acid synthetase